MSDSISHLIYNIMIEKFQTLTATSCYLETSLVPQKMSLL